LFFFNDARTMKREELVNDLAGIILPAKLGTMLERTERVKKLAVALAQKLAP